MFHSLNVPLIATFCEACQALLLQMKIVFQKSGPLKPAVSAETAYECRCWGLVWFYGSWSHTQGDTRYGLDRVELLRWRPFPVRFTATVETSMGRGENWSLLL